MILFCSDLDNTLIYSYRHEIGIEKRCVEVYQGREISFLTEKTYELLKEIRQQFLFVPVTTRSLEQYRRIDLGIGIPRYALTCNGGVLLKNGTEDESWYARSLELISGSTEELLYGKRLLEQDKNRCFEVRDIQGLFIFTKSEKPLASVGMLKEFLDANRVDVFSNGAKVYVVPKELNKGAAVRRLKERLRAEKLIAAGDSEFDIPMLCEADVAIAPIELKDRQGLRKGVRYMTGRKLFSEELLFSLRNFCF